ncbi:hypothetical protein SLS56_008763 [Neofusicoccum ribis]|uniref:Uncharacterized protein n=1 Tax=Neofusicoccum ribis TaxID=45134 RepID=A0ABR3SJ58_9PEZI
MAGAEKLAAISALARATYLKRHTDYIAGLWRDSIIPGLTWRRQGPRGQKNKAYNCPSWSWASQDSIVSYQWAGEQRGEGLFMPQVLDVIWEPDSANMFGDVRSAHIVLDTTITTGGVMPDHFRRYEPFQHDAHYIQAVIISDPERAVLWHATATMDDAGVGGKMVAVAVLSTYYSERIFLLLDPPDLDAEEYRRVGIAIMGCSDGENPKVQGDIASGWKRITIKLV